MESDFEIFDMARTKHETTDALFSMPTNGSHSSFLEDEISVMDLTQLNKNFFISPRIDTREGPTAETNLAFQSGPQTLLEFIMAKRADKHNNTVHKFISLPQIIFICDKNGIIAMEALIDDVSHKVVPTLLCTTILNFAHCSAPASHPGERCMYD